MSDTEAEPLSALHENISRKGNNSYYYAHGKKIDGPAWDGKEEPRLIAVGESTKATPKQPTISIDSYSWTDERKSVKIYLDFENANEIGDDSISFTNTDKSIEFKVDKDGKSFVFVVSSLNDSIESVSFKKKSDKFLLVLKKASEGDWEQLKKTS